MNSKFVMVHVRANLRPLYNTKCPPYGIAKCIFKDNRVSFAYTLPIKPKSFMLHFRAILRPVFPFGPPMAVGKSGLGFALAQSIAEIWHS